MQWLKPSLFAAYRVSTTHLCRDYIWIIISHHKDLVMNQSAVAHVLPEKGTLPFSQRHRGAEVWSCLGFWALVETQRVRRCQNGISMIPENPKKGAVFTKPPPSGNFWSAFLFVCCPYHGRKSRTDRRSSPELIFRAQKKTGRVGVSNGWNSLMILREAENCEVLITTFGTLTWYFKWSHLFF